MQALPYLAWTRSGGAQRSASANSIDHGTLDGVQTLCGANVCGAEAGLAFDKDAPFACTRCAKAVPLQLDPEVARIFSGETEEQAARKTEVKAVYLARKQIEGKVRERIDRATDLTCAQSGLVDGVWHVEGGTDPDGHTVNLHAEWGSVCTCGDHVWNHTMCKHLICVEFVLGAVLYDRVPDLNPANGSGCYKPGIFSRAVQVDLENAAYRAAKNEAGVS